MTSEQIQKLCLIVAENGARLPDGSAGAVSLMHVQMLAEIALQLAIRNEAEGFADVPSQSPELVRCVQCDHPRGCHESDGKCQASKKTPHGKTFRDEGCLCEKFQPGGEA